MYVNSSNNSWKICIFLQWSIVFSYECIDVHSTSSSPIESSVRKNPTRDILPLHCDVGFKWQGKLYWPTTTSIPIKFCRYSTQQKKISSVHQILFQIMLWDISVLGRGGRGGGCVWLKRVNKWKNKKSCGKRRRERDQITLKTHFYKCNRVKTSQ